MGHSKAQKSAFSGLFCGFLMCAVCTFAPFWIHAQNRSATATADAGPWLYCVKYPDIKLCEFYDSTEDDSAEIWTSRMASIALLLLCLICDFVGLCKVCCYTNGKTTKHAVIAFFAGCTGIVTIAVFDRTVEDQISDLKIETSYGWAFRLYIVGIIIIFIAAVTLKFSEPDNPDQQVSITTIEENAVVVADVTQLMPSFGTPQYQYPNAMFTGPSTAMYPGQYQPQDLQQPHNNYHFSTQPQMNSEYMSKHPSSY